MTTVQMTRLGNGIRVVSDQMPGLRSVSVGLWIDAGSRYELASENGISHMLEHMLFKGTKRRSARAIAEEIEDVGGHMNAFTSRDHTSFYARVLAEDLPLAVDLLADILQNSLLDAAEIAREREVIIQEIGQTEDTPDDIIFDHLQEVAFPGQPLGRSILGTPASVRSFTPDMLRHYLETHYRGENVVLVAAGAVEHEMLVRLAGEALAASPAGPSTRCEASRWHGGERRERRHTEQLHMAFGFSGVAFDDPDFYAVQVLATMLGGGMSSRLFQEVRENRGLAYSIYAFSSSHADSGLFGIYAGTSDESAAELVRLVASETLQMTEAAPEAEIARARAQLKAGLLMSLESSSSRIEQIGRQILVFNRIVPIEEMVARVEAVDAGAVASVCARLLEHGKPALSVIGPGKHVPDFESFAAMFRRG